MDNPKTDALARPVELVSDFSDYYDQHLVDGEGTPYLRYSRCMSNELRRDQALPSLMAKDFSVPVHGLVRNIPRGIDLIAVYGYDSERPRSERCAVMPRSDALAECPDSFAVAYKGEIGAPSVSYREVCVGNSRWLLKYVSDHTWASNQGYVEVTLEDQLESAWDARFPFPVYALDYVVASEHAGWHNGYRKDRYYFDFQPYPKIEDTPIPNRLPPKRAADLIKEALARHYVLNTQPKKRLTNPSPASYTKVSDHETWRD